MPAALTWDALNWDSATWDGEVAAAPRKTMNNTKAIINFEDYSASELGPVAQNIHDKMTLNAASFADPPVTMAALQTLITSYDAKLVARASRAKADIIAFNEVREELRDKLGVLGNYVNGVANGDPVVVEQSGFPSYETTRVQDNSPPAAPTNLRVRQGDVSGAMVARYKPDRPQSVNEVQTTTGDPTVESAWQTKGLFKGGRAEMDGFTPGTLVWVRVRTVGLKGVMGAWSDPAQLRVV